MYQWMVLSRPLLNYSDITADLLSSIDSYGDVANSGVQIVAVAQAEASDVYAALSRPTCREAGGLMFPLCLVVRKDRIQLNQVSYTCTEPTHSRSYLMTHKSRSCICVNKHMNISKLHSPPLHTLLHLWPWFGTCILLGISGKSRSVAVLCTETCPLPESAYYLSIY